MSLVTKVNIVLKSLYIYGICPFKFNKLSNNFCCNSYYTFYSAFICVVASSNIAYDILTEILDVGFVQYFFRNTISSLSSLMTASVLIIYLLQMLDLFIRRSSHVNLLNKVLQMDEKISEISLKYNYGLAKTTLPKFAWHHFLISIFVVIIKISIFVKNLPTLAMPELLQFLSAILVILQIITILQIPIYIRNFALILNQNFNKVRLLLNKLIEFYAIDRLAVLTCFELFEELERLKTLFSDTFGVQILIIYLNDFIILTSTLYFLTYQLYIGFTWNYFYMFLCMCFPNIIQCILLTSTLDKLGEQVNIALDIIC